MTSAVQAPVRPSTRWMRVVSIASARIISGRMIVRRRASLDVPALGGPGTRRHALQLDLSLLHRDGRQSTSTSCCALCVMRPLTAGGGQVISVVSALCMPLAQSVHREMSSGPLRLRIAGHRVLCSGCLRIYGSWEEALARAVNARRGEGQTASVAPAARPAFSSLRRLTG
jgi:hypothetical protein